MSSDVEIPALTSADDFGERHQPYSLPTQRIEPFVEKNTNLPWRPVTPATIEQLAQRSAERVQQSDEFAEIQTKIDEARSRDSVVQLSEILEENARTAAAGDAAVAPPTAPGENSEEDDEPSVQQREALAILTDLVLISGDS